MPAFRTNLAAMGLIAGSIVTAQAQDTKEADLRCMAVMAKINHLPDPARQSESCIGGYYCMGRLEVEAPDLKLGPSTADAYNKMSPSEFLSETQRCEQEMKTKSLREIGAAMPKAQPDSK